METCSMLKEAGLESLLRTRWTVGSMMEGKNKHEMMEING